MTPDVANRPRPGRPLLALDTGSPLVSVALGDGRQLLAARQIEQGPSSRHLLRLIGEALAEAKLKLADLGGVVALQGPGSFTGLRIGLATALGFHQALGLPATALPTLQVLAATGAGDAPRLAVVDALRGQWFSQRFAAATPPQPLEPPTLRTAAELAASAYGTLVGFGLERLATDWPEDLAQPPGPLAPVGLALALAIATSEWQPARLTQPLYLRPPATTPPP